MNRDTTGKTAKGGIMFAIFVTINVKEEHLDEFTRASFGDAEGACRDEPGCFRFDINQDAEIPTRFYLYEVYRDEEEAFQGSPRSPTLQRVDLNCQADVRWRSPESYDENRVSI